MDNEQVVDTYRGFDIIDRSVMLNEGGKLKRSERYWAKVTRPSGEQAIINAHSVPDIRARIDRYIDRSLSQ
jgi:hypothetical protein